jgi:hypothetical protein
MLLIPLVMANCDTNDGDRRWFKVQAEPRRIPWTDAEIVHQQHVQKSNWLKKTLSRMGLATTSNANGSRWPLEARREIAEYPSPTGPPSPADRSASHCPWRTKPSRPRPRPRRQSPEP